VETTFTLKKDTRLCNHPRLPDDEGFFMLVGHLDLSWSPDQQLAIYAKNLRKALAAYDAKAAPGPQATP
jgi:hypothetical protein